MTSSPAPTGRLRHLTRPHLSSTRRSDLVRVDLDRRRVDLALAVALLASSAICACGDDETGVVDAGIGDDARPAIDAALIPCSADADAGCEGAPLRPLCNLDRGACVECLGDGDCARVAAFGPACDEEAGYCQCETDDDCSGNVNGPFCHEVVRACTCLFDDDCAGDQDCKLEPYLGNDVRTCREIGEQ